MFGVKKRNWKIDEDFCLAVKKKSKQFWRWRIWPCKPQKKRKTFGLWVFFGKLIRDLIGGRVFRLHHPCGVCFLVMQLLLSSSYPCWQPQYKPHWFTKLGLAHCYFGLLWAPYMGWVILCLPKKSLSHKEYLITSTSTCWGTCCPIWRRVTKLLKSIREYNFMVLKFVISPTY